MSGEKRHSSTCGEVGYCNGCTPTPEPSEVAETTAGEREVEALAKVINPSAFTADFRASQDGARSMARAVLASDWLAALLDRERRKVGERIAEAIEADIARDPHYAPRRCALEEAAEIARDEAAR